jgi:hypothetical protein
LQCPTLGALSAVQLHRRRLFTQVCSHTHTHTRLRYFCC